MYRLHLFCSGSSLSTHNRLLLRSLVPCILKLSIVCSMIRRFVRRGAETEHQQFNAGVRALRLLNLPNSQGSGTVGGSCK